MDFIYKKCNIIWKSIGADEYNEIKKTLKDSNKVHLSINKLYINKFKSGNWIEYGSKYTKDLTFLVINDKYTIKAYRCNICVNTVDKSEASHNALKNIRDKFKERTNKTFKTCFGTVEEKYLRCVPKQFYWSKKEPYEGLVSSVDYSSHYNSNICGLLPDAHTAIIKKGTVKPTKEYPFAFYLNSGHLAIYKELDTHTWLFNNKFEKEDLFRFKTIKKLDTCYDDRFKEFISYDEDETVLMKPSTEQLDPEMEYFYEQKDIDEDAKMTLVAAIGQMHRKRYNRDKYAHLAAVAIARANQKMLDLTNNLELKDILQIQVDGIIYTKDKILGIPEKDKYLGAPVQEAYNRPCKWRALGCYMIQLNDKMKIKCQGYNAMTDGRKPEESKTFGDMELWIKE